MYMAITLAPGLGGTVALLVVVLIEMITVMVVATIGDGRGSMGSTEWGIRVAEGRGRRREEGRIRMVDAMRKIRTRMVLLDFGGIGGPVGRMMSLGDV